MAGRVVAAGTGALLFAGGFLAGTYDLVTAGAVMFCLAALMKLADEGESET